MVGAAHAPLHPQTRPAGAARASHVCLSSSRAAMDALYASGVLFAEVLQSGPPCLERFWLWATFLGDPKCVFIVCFPLAYFLNRKVGVAVLWIGLISEWLNVVLKW